MSLICDHVESPLADPKLIKPFPTCLVIDSDTVLSVSSFRQGNPLISVSNIFRPDYLMGCSLRTLCVPLAHEFLFLCSFCSMLTDLV
ncbi:hypothetical protein HZH66_013976 [Vespula vulgaris]|uniref:Uncharacterized protein n=1 Tax=Vespula vulgaris TaxID=7454 RepID=A0A834J6R0_VESVU|nr:hypothetical protein HZH66_013976 [Vespula vulgaris]